MDDHPFLHKGLVRHSVILKDFLGFLLSFSLGTFLGNQFSDGSSDEAEEVASVGGVVGEQLRIGLVERQHFVHALGDSVFGWTFRMD